MPLISLRNFEGEIPKTEPHLLPQTRARLAENCDFADGVLRPHLGGLLLQTMANNPVKGIYTEDGLLFYTWAQETIAIKSPILNDAFGRIYYLTPSEGQLRVTTKVGMAVNGPSPATSFLVGVPRPTVAPVLRTVERNTYPDYPNVSFTATAWWDYNGTRYSEAAVAVVTVTALRQFTITPPALPGAPPEGVTPVLVCRLRVLDLNNANASVLDMTVKAGQTAGSNSLPGSVELELGLSSLTSATLRLSYGAEVSRAYTYTYENTWEEESSNAPPATISPTYVQDVTVGVTAADFTGYRPFSRYRIYRTYGNNTTYLRTEVTGAAPTFTDGSRRPGAAGLALESADFFPPQTGLEGLAVTAGGWLVAFKDNTLYKTVPYRPYAWAYEETFPTAIRGIMVTQAGIVVACAGGIYLVPTDAPNARGTLPLDSPQAGIAQRSMVVMDGAGAFASNDGIVLVTGSVASIAGSQRLFNRKTWREEYGDILDDFSMRLSYHDGFLVATSNTQAKGFILRLDEDVGSYVRFPLQADSAFQLPITDTLYYSVGAGVYRFQAGDALTFDWWSREFIFGRAVSIGAGYIRCDGPTTIRVYADGVLHHTTVESTGFFRVPPIRANRWSFRLGGAAAVHEITLGQSMVELQNV